MNSPLFDELYRINVNENVEKKNGLSYLSWAWGWAEFKKKCPDATYTIKQFGDNQLPYVYDPNTGYMVFTSVTAGGMTHDMWLPVMDGANKAMKNASYTYDTKFKKNVVCEAATMFDINKTIMRCLVKNLAMFGLGLYIYAGEDLPEPTEEPHQSHQDIPPPALKAKYELFKGSMDGFDLWVVGQQEKGRNYREMEHILQEGLNKKKESA